MRIYDPRVGRFLSVDPIAKEYPWYTPYQFAGNKPILSIDLDGLEEVETTWWFSTQTKGKVKLEKSDYTRIQSDKPRNEIYVIYVDGKRYNTNSTQTVRGRDDNNDEIGDFSEVKTLNKADLLQVIGYSSFVAYDLYLGNIESAVLNESNAGPYKNVRSLLDFKGRTFEMFNIKSDALIDIDGTVYNSNEVGNYLWGMALDYLGFAMDAKALAEAGTRGRPDEPHEQKAIQAGQNKLRSLDSEMSEGDKDVIFNSRMYYKGEHQVYLEKGGKTEEWRPEKAAPKD